MSKLIIFQAKCNVNSYIRNKEGSPSTNVPYHSLTTHKPMEKRLHGERHYFVVIRTCTILFLSGI